MLTDSKTIDIQGHEFILKPFTRKNLAAFKEGQDALVEAEFTDGEFVDKIFDYYKGCLPLVCDGPFDKIDWEQMDGHLAEDIIMSFVPKSIRLYASLSGFSE
jgi:hypothetical protein